jgi:DNA-binding Lrp family transcriptional regulator
LTLVLDDLDKKVLQQLSSGICSYEDVATKLGVTRGTIYRRIERMETNQIITKRIVALPNYSNLDISAIFIGIKVNYDLSEKLVEELTELKSLKILWLSYGEYDIFATLMCQKGSEGSSINELRKVASPYASKIHQISIGYDWRKVNLSPF